MEPLATLQHLRITTLRQDTLKAIIDQHPVAEVIAAIDAFPELPSESLRQLVHISSLEEDHLPIFQASVRLTAKTPFVAEVFRFKQRQFLRKLFVRDDIAMFISASEHYQWPSQDLLYRCYEHKSQQILRHYITHNPVHDSQLIEGLLSPVGGLASFPAMFLFFLSHISSITSLEARKYAMGLGERMDDAANYVEHDELLALTLKAKCETIRGYFYRALLKQTKQTPLTLLANPVHAENKAILLALIY